MTDRARRRSPAMFLLLALAALPSAAAAQDTVTAGEPGTAAVRVVRDRATIWSRNPSMVLAVVPTGTVLQAISRDNQWIEVVVPAAAGGKGGSGFIYEGHVERVPGSPEPPRRQARQSDSKWDPVGGSSRGATAPRPRPAFGIRGFGSFSYMTFRSEDSFEAVLGGSSQPFFGGGGQVVLWDRLFVSTSLERYKETGQRVLVLEDEVFPLGIANTVTITPLTVSAGYRLRSTDEIVPYVGGGIGSYQYQESSDFAAGDENVDERFTSYHGLVGVEYAATRWLFAAFEVQYTAVPDALGAPGVSEAFDETDLGGFSIAVKLMVGR